MSATRRLLLGAGATFACGAKALAQAGSGAGMPTDVFQAIFERYAGYGVKATGGAGDSSCGAWLEDQLKAYGYTVARQGFEAPAFDVESAFLSTGPVKTAVWPQPIVVQTPPAGLTAKLAVMGQQPVAGAIALVVLPSRRWSTAVAPEIRGPVAAAFAAGALAVVVVTTGPSGQALALNAPADKPLHERPVAVLAPDAAKPFIEAAAAGRDGLLQVRGRAYSTRAFNVIGALDRGAGRTLVISTPRSGWFTCMGERGPGIAVWLALARWAVRPELDCDIRLLATSGHEYENLGGAHFLEEAAPPPDRTALWLHLGANVAARDWRDTPNGAEPLPTADPQRVLMATPGLIGALTAEFRGQPGLERPVTPQERAPAGELANILAARYPQAIGIFGSHRLHHAPTDDLRCVSAPLAREVADSFARVISSRLG